MGAEGGCHALKLLWGRPAVSRCRVVVCCALRLAGWSGLILSTLARAEAQCQSNEAGRRAVPLEPSVCEGDGL